MRNLIILSTLLMLLPSCSSNDDSTAEEEQNTTQTRVKAININGNLFYNMVYNEKSRIATITIKSGSGITSSTIYTYNEQNQPTKKGEAIYTYNAEGRPNTITTSNYTTDLTYNQAGKLLTEEVVTNHSYSINRTFIYDAQNLLTEIKEHHIANNTGSTPYRKFIITYNNNANITKVVEKWSFDNTTYTDRFETTFGYDDKNNPLLNLQLNTGGNQGISHYMGVLHHYGSNSILFSESRLYFYGKNNPIFSTRTDLNDNKKYKTTYEHQYNIDGYPIITTETIFNPNSQTSDEIKYAWTYEKK